MTTLWVCCTVTALVSAVLLWSIARFPKSAAVGSRATFRHHPLVETLWALIPVLIVILSAWPSIRERLAEERRSAPATALAAAEKAFQDNSASL